MYRFSHQSISHLKLLLEKYASRFRHIFVITESVFSMDGDTANLKELILLKQNFPITFILDEAHATGLFGQTGSGLAQSEGVNSHIDILIGTYGKALGGFGGYVAGSLLLKKYLIQKCRSFIYSTALPPSICLSAMSAMNLISTEPERRNLVQKNAHFLRALLQNQGWKTNSTTPIIPILMPDNETALRKAQQLRDEGFWVTAIRKPTVPTPRLRLSITWNHPQNILMDLVEVFGKPTHPA